MNRVWVIEMLVDDKWEPTVGCALTKREGVNEAQKWRRNNPSEVFRIVKYVPMLPSETSEEPK